jgi:hypothetical protein
MPTVKVFLKGVSKALEFPESTKMEAIEKVVGNWDNVADVKDLPMDTASRMDRARYLGFDVDSTLYHGTPDARGIWAEGFSKKGSAGLGPDKPLFFSRDKDLAKTYADDARAFDYQRAEPEVIEVFSNAGNTKDLDWGGSAFRENSVFGGKKDLHHSIDAAKAEGFDSVDVSNIRDTYRAGGPPSNVYVVFDPKNMRSTNATFNPAKKESSNLLASLAGGAVGAGALSANDVEAATNRLLELGKIKQESRVYNIPHPTLNKLGLFLQRGPQSFFTEGVGRGLETLSYGRQNELTDEERRRRAIAVALDFL